MGGAPIRSYADGWRTHPVSRSPRKAVHRYMTPRVLRYGGDATRSGARPVIPGCSRKPGYSALSAQSCETLPLTLPEQLPF